VDWSAKQGRDQANLTNRIREILRDRGRLSAKQVASILSEDTGQPKANRHWVNAILYNRRDWFRQIPVPFWKPAQWEAIPDEDPVLGPQAASESLHLGIIEPVVDKATASRTAAEPTAEEIALRRERERRRAAGSAPPFPRSGRSDKGVHPSSPTFGLSDDFHKWAQRERPEYRDQDPG